MRWLVLLAAVAAEMVASDATARSAASTLLRIPVGAAADGSTVRCADDSHCSASPATDGACGVSLGLCVDAHVRGGILRLRTGGTSLVAATMRAGLGTVPGAVSLARAVRFSPPLRPGCLPVTSVALRRGASEQLLLAGRTAGGRPARTRMWVSCDGEPPGPGDPAPPPPPPPSPPPPPPAVVPFRFVRETIDAEGGGQLTSDVAAGDIDGDGVPDVVVAGFQSLLWYRTPDWAPATIASGAFGRGAKTIVRDMDGDGRLDIVTGYLDPTLPPLQDLTTIWFRNTPGAWELHLLSDAAYCHDLVFGDLDGDGRDDALCLDQQRGQVLWLVPGPDPLAPWTVRTIDPNENAMGSAIADIDGDGRPDVVVGRAWYRNQGDGSWIRHQYTNVTVAGYDGFRDYAKVSVLDLDGNGRLDIFATLYAETPAGHVYAFLAPPDPGADEPWTEVAIDPGPLFGVHSQAAASFDGSARPQIMVGETNIGGFDFGIAPHPHLYVYRLLGAPREPSGWERTAIDAIGAHEVQAVDLDRDGLPDLIGHEENTEVIGRNGAVYAWRNQTAR